MVTVDGVLDDTAGPEAESESDDADRTSSDLSTDDVFHILQTKRRRDALRYMRDADGPVRLRDLAEAIAAREQDTTVEGLTSDERQRVYISLYQTHLPKLDEEGIVDYDKDRGIVERTPEAAAFDPYLEGGAGGTTDPWPRRYAAATGVGTVVVAGSGAVGFVSLPGLVASVLALGTFAAVTAAHAIETGASTTLSAARERLSR